MDDLWIAYKCKSGQTLFTYNKQTGEHKWLNEANNESLTFKEFRCIAIQTDDTVCDNGCTSMYVKQDSCSVVPLNKSNSSEDFYQTKLDESDDTGQELIGITPPFNKLSYSLEHGETSGIYEVSVVDVLEELHVEYPSESNDEEGESPTTHVATGTENATERNLVKNKASDTSASLRSTPIIRDSDSAVEVKSDEILKDNYIDPSYRIKRFYKCSHCQRQFDSKGKLNDHIRTHTGEKPYECIYCSRKFAKKCNLQRHLRRHTGERNYSCSLCEKKFIDSAELQRHMISHTKKKAFECPYCEKRFAQKNTLTCHLRRHTGIGKSFDCTVCGRQFEHRSDLKRHIRTHTGEKPYGCTYCDKKFPTKYSVNRHIRSHTGEKPFECSTCEKKFAEKKNLEYHMTIHTGEKRFECSTCDKKFARKLYWDNHRRKCTGTKNLDCSDDIELSNSPLSMVHDFKTSETSFNKTDSLVST